MGLGGGFQVFQGLDPQLFEQHLGLFGADALHSHDFVQGNGHLLFEIFVVLHAAGGEILFDLPGHAVAHPGNGLEGLEAAGFIEIFDVVF
jgi:hypothetical protein